MNCTLAELAGGQKERVELLEKMKVIEEEGKGREREGGEERGEGGDASVAICLCANSWLLWQPVKSHYL